MSLVSVTALLMLVLYVPVPQKISVVLVTTNSSLALHSSMTDPYELMKWGPSTTVVSSDANSVTTVSYTHLTLPTTPYV